MKTPEKMAEDWAKAESANLDIDCDVCDGGDDKRVCANCRHIYWGGVRCFLAGYAAAQTNSLTSGKWISLMTKTPPMKNDADETMLFLTIDEQLRMDVLFWDCRDWSDMNITHWMPLPEAPKENE